MQLNSAFVHTKQIYSMRSFQLKEAESARGSHTISLIFFLLWHSILTSHCLTESEREVQKPCQRTRCRGILSVVNSILARKMLLHASLKGVHGVGRRKTCDGNEFHLEMVRHRKELPNFFVHVGMLSTVKWWQRWPARVVL
jgi:hypothetical protein